MGRVIKFEIMFTVHNRDFTKSITKTYTTLDMLIDGNDDTDYDEIDIIAKRQFTGLTDKNGVDIYEGDIVKSVSEILRPFDRSVKTRTGEYVTNYKAIEYREDKSSFCFVGCPITGISQTLATKYHEVIGNIHQNPELLEAK